MYEDAGLSNRLSARIAGAFEGLRPVSFGPGTLVRTWGTRPISIWVCYETCPSGGYSARSVSTGSIFAIRSAGRRLATAAIAISRRGTLTRVTRS
jgi:hypothetical protein